MIFETFVTETKSIWVQYLAYVSTMQANGNLDSNGGSVLYPNILLVTNCSGFYVAELVGVTKIFNGLTVKRHKEKSIYRYLSQFDDSEPDPLVHMDGSNHGFRFLCLAQKADFKALEKRFPTIELYGSKLNRTGGKGSVFSFGENFESCLIENSILVNRLGHLYRCKNILAAYIFKSTVTKPKLVEFFKKGLEEKEVKGVHTIQGKPEEQLIVAGQLQSMYLLPGLHETTIGEFLKLHPEIIKSAFKTEHFEYEPYLQWLEHDGTCEDVAINPDLLVRRPDGYYDIYDLKTAALAKKNVTKGGRKRRRFIDYVEEGVAQLVNYEEYFTYPKNAKHAKEKYGIEVKEPKLVLVVGSWENSSPEEVKQAQRRYHNIEIIDYDTFCHLFIGAS
ncbi:Shedu anti-phage system protein SduA domain-containing protein [Acidihalobacter prosperus]|uniref:Shedu anti-phage system protein SduA domain-containing protein n=1 Tax=Acidihalobacter prosperus TaxID=160660 RepID=UPI0009EDAC93|nr:Shedu anti-phage system protein SduA domain-containing protein [Acidihalobacter prosperus]